MIAFSPSLSLQTLFLRWAKSLGNSPLQAGHLVGRLSSVSSRGVQKFEVCIAESFFAVGVFFEWAFGRAKALSFKFLVLASISAGEMAGDRAVAVKIEDEVEAVGPVSSLGIF